MSWLLPSACALVCARVLRRGATVCACPWHLHAPGAARPPRLAASGPPSVSTHAIALAGRRASKLVSLVVSCFTATYVRRWAEFLPGTPLLSTPMFDGRAVCYPNLAVLRDYLSWRQVDTHINNLVRGGERGTRPHLRSRDGASEHAVPVRPGSSPTFPSSPPNC